MPPAVECDVTKRADVRDAVARSEVALGPIERLVANAGGGERTSVDPFDADHVERVITLNVMGTAYCIEAVLPGMLERGSGHLVAMSSLAGSRGPSTDCSLTSFCFTRIEEPKSA